MGNGPPGPADGIDYDTSLAGCQECGAVVYDVDQHTAWHDATIQAGVEHPTKHPTKHPTNALHLPFQPA